MGKFLMALVAVSIATTAFADQLYCWTPSDYGTKNPPTCALSYDACQRLVSRNGGSCRSM
jgi:hypothetical protein